MNVFNQPVFVILQFSLKKKNINRSSFPWGVAALSWANPETTNYWCTAHEFQPTVWSQHRWPSWPQALPHLSSRAMSVAKGQVSFPASSGEPRSCPGWKSGPYHMEEWCNSPLLRWMGCCQSRTMQWLKPRLPRWWQLWGADPLGPSGKEQIIAVLHIIAALINHTHRWCADRTCGTHRAVSLFPFTQEKTKADPGVQTRPAWAFLANTRRLTWVYKKLRTVIPSHTQAI